MVNLVQGNTIPLFLGNALGRSAIDSAWAKESFQGWWSLESWCMSYPNTNWFRGSRHGVRVAGLQSGATPQAMQIIYSRSSRVVVQ